MKRGIFVAIFAVAFVLMGIASVSAATCTINPTLVSQDPYPAIPGDYVKLVFQVSGMSNPDCGQVTFQLVPNFPISFDPGTSSYFTANGGIYAHDYSSNLIIPYKVKVNPNAIDGNSTINLKYSQTSSGNYSVNNYFNLSINDVRSNFSTFVEDYDFATDTMTLEILNTGKNDVDALTIEVPSQDNFTVKGPNMNVVGSLDSNDYSTASFEVSPHKGDMKIIIYYNDITGTRRSVNQTVYFNPVQFEGRKTASSGSPWGYIILFIIIAAIIGYIIYRRHKKNKKKRLLRE